MQIPLDTFTGHDEILKETYIFKDIFLIMKHSLILLLLSISICVHSQQFYALESTLKKSAFAIEDLTKYNSRKYFVFAKKDRDSIINGLEKYLLLITTIGRSPFTFDQTKAGSSTLKVLSKPMAYGDRYSVSIETVIDNNTWQMMFGHEKNRNSTTADKIKRFLFILKSV